MKRIQLITLKRVIEEMIMFPFVLLGKIIARINPLKEEYDLFMFFSHYSIGGADKVNAEIVAAIPDRKIIIFFTRHSIDTKFLHMFKQPNVTVVEIQKWTDNKWIYPANFIYRGICAHYINSQKKSPVVFSTQCNFAYKLMPHLDRNIRNVESHHNALRHFAGITWPFVKFMDARVTFTDVIINQHKEYYRQIGLPEEYGNRFNKIVNCVHVPSYKEKQRGARLRIYYAGRGGYHKRLELLFAIFRQCMAEQLPLEYHLAGTFEDEIPADLKNKMVWHGGIGNEEDMYRLHYDMDILLMSSRFEGFPMVISEAMSCGVAIVAPAIYGIPEHIKNGANGYLMQEGPEEHMIKEAVDSIKKLIGDPVLLDTIGKNNHAYAETNFSRKVFAAKYRKVLGVE